MATRFAPVSYDTNDARIAAAFCHKFIIMSAQRPFFANFLAAFRLHSTITQQTKGPSTPPTSQITHTSTTAAAVSPSPSNPRSTATASKPTGATTSALTQLHSPRANSASPLSRSPGPSTSPGPYMQPGTVPTRDRIRRGSDSSCEGFRDVRGADKWYIGGRTATGEERFFKLGVVKRNRSIDRLSLDRLSL